MDSEAINLLLGEDADPIRAYARQIAGRDPETAGELTRLARYYDRYSTRSYEANAAGIRQIIQFVGQLVGENLSHYEAERLARCLYACGNAFPGEPGTDLFLRVLTHHVPPRSKERVTGNGRKGA